MDGQVLMHTDEVITQSFSSYHQAIDIVGEGHSVSDVIAVSDGTVEIAVNTVTTNNKNARGTASYGNFVKIKHDDGTKSLYAHLKPGSVSVKTGERISEGDKIGTMGNTGNAHGVHLHFEIRNSDETRVNPANYMANKKQEELVLEKSEIVSDSIDSEVKSNAPIPSLDNELTMNVTGSDSINNKGISKSSNSSDVVASNSLDSNNVESGYIGNPSYKHGSIVDGLKLIGIDSSFDYRTLLAHANGIDDYHGTYSQNVYLLNLLKQGKLKKV